MSNRFSGEEVKEDLEFYKAEISFPEFQAPSNIQEAINSLSNHRTLDPQTLHEKAIDFALYSLYLTQEENKLNALINWCNGNLRVIIGEEASNYPGTWYKEKEDIIIATHEMAKQLDSIRSLASVKLDTIRYMSQRMQILSEALKKFSYSKQRLNHESH